MSSPETQAGSTPTTPEDTRAPEGVTRRQLLIAAGAGGVALAATAVGAAKVGSIATSAQYELELKKLRTVVALYEQLDKIGLDAILTTGMNIVRGSLDAVKTGVQLMRDGIATTENAFKAFQRLIDSFKGATALANNVLTGLMDKFHAAESVVGSVLGKAQPLADSIGGFFAELLQKIPFGIGDNIHRAVDALVSLIQAIPTTVQTVMTQLLKPLTDTFFPAAGTSPVQTTLFDPITQHLLQPLDHFLGDVQSLLDHWEKDLNTPVQSALEQRSQVRQQISEYRKANNV